jgi:AraC family transcriptional regulator
MKLNIKNMVCDRCKKVVKDEMEKLGVGLNRVELGEVETENDLDSDKLNEVKLML